MAVLGGYRITRTGVLFIIGILVLGGLVTGGIFLVKNHGEAVRRDQAVKIAEQNLKDQSQTPTHTTNSINNSGETGASTDTGSTSGTSTNTGTTATTSTTSTTTSTAHSSDELPVTGINTVQFIEQAAILAAVTLAAAYFVTSRTSRRAADRL